MPIHPRQAHSRLLELLSRAAAAVFVLFIFTMGAFAGKSRQTGTFEDTVTAVGPDSITVKTGRNAGTKVTHLAEVDQKKSTEGASNVVRLKVDSFSKITVDGLPGTLADVKRGMMVQFVQGMDPGIASSIDAHTVPPPIKASKKAPTPKKDDRQKRGKGATVKAVSRKITGDIILSISTTRITIGQVGSKTAEAYYITPRTTVTIDGVSASPDDLREGMDVNVHGDSTTAAEIEAYSER